MKVRDARVQAALDIDRKACKIAAKARNARELATRATRPSSALSSAFCAGAADPAYASPPLHRRFHVDSSISAYAAVADSAESEVFEASPSPPHSTPSSTVEWVEAASSNLRLKARVADKVFESAERLAEVAEARTKELNATEETLKRVVKELECFKRLEAKLIERGVVGESVMRRAKWDVVREMRGGGGVGNVGGRAVELR